MANSLVIYFSCTGTTERAAEIIAQNIEADIYHVVPEKKYTVEDLNWNKPDSRANQEQRDEASRPKYYGTLPDLTKYDTVIIGHPIWWGIPPKIIQTVIEQLDFTDKMVATFGTSGGSNYNKAQAIIEQWFDFKVKEGRILSSQSSIENWLANVGVS